MNISRCLFVLLLLFFSSCGQTGGGNADTIQKQKQPLLPTESDAIQFAEPILFKTYGQKHIESQRPYNIVKTNNCWIITGTLAEGWKGGTFLISIDAADGRVIEMGHTK